MKDKHSGLKVGLLREGKSPPDSRVVMTPMQVREAMNQYPGLDIVVQPSPIRCYSDDEYRDAGIELQEDLSDRDVLIGVKEVPVDDLLSNKTYFFFSHTIKKQAYNRKLLQDVIRKNIRLIDYECLTDDHGIRVIAFGRWAGIVGAHNGLYTWGERTGDYSLKRARDCRDYADLKDQYQNVEFPPIKIATTGSGRVARGANELLEHAGIREVAPRELLKLDFNEAVFANLKCEHLYERISDHRFELQDFFSHPDQYSGIFRPFTRVIDLFINSIYWDPTAPVYFTAGEMADPEFKIKAIADITCDIAPASSIPSTLRASAIESPVYGYDPVTQSETKAYRTASIDIMAVDNLPNELPRDASQSFGVQFNTSVLAELVENSRKGSRFLERGTIARNGDLTPGYEYLSDYVEGG